MPGIRGLIVNGLSACSSPTAWSLARRSIKRHGAIQHVDELTAFAKIVRRQQPRRVLEIGTARGGMFWLLCRLVPWRLTALEGRGLTRILVKFAAHSP
jgi:predicted O-methyltransferase YrrM